MRRRWLVLGEFAKYAFFGLKRKRRDFERSVLKYVSIKIPALTHSGRKSRVCVNAADRLCPGAKNKTSLSFPASPPQNLACSLLLSPFLCVCLSSSAFPAFPAFRGSSAKAGCERQQCKAGRGNDCYGKSAKGNRAGRALEKCREGLFFVPGARACRAYLRKPDFSSLNASAPGF